MSLKERFIRRMQYAELEVALGKIYGDRPAAKRVAKRARKMQVPPEDVLEFALLGDHTPQNSRKP